MERLLVTGATGFLGVRCVSWFSDKYELIPCSHADLDICDRRAVVDFFRCYRPSRVIHTAAVSDTGYAEAHPEKSLLVNVDGTVNIAMACQEVGAKLIFMSSDQVYSGVPGTKKNVEDQILVPQPVYGKHKLMAEECVRDVLPSAVGLRLTWMYDSLSSPYRLNRNILFQLDAACRNECPLKVPIYDFRGITNVWEVVSRLESCWALPGGIYNFGCENSLNAFDTFCAVANLLGWSSLEGSIIPDHVRFADAPRNLLLDLEKLRSFGLDFPDTIEGLRIFLSDKK